MMGMSTPRRVAGRNDQEGYAEWAKRALDNAVQAGPGVTAHVPVFHLGVEAVLDYVVVLDGVDHQLRCEPGVNADADSLDALVVLCYYAEALEEMTGTTAQSLWLFDQAGTKNAVDAKAPLAYWRQHKKTLPTSAASIDELVYCVTSTTLPVVRGPILFEEPEDEDMIDLAAKLRAQPDQESQLLAELLFYWRRERSAQVTDALDTLRTDTFSLLSNEDVIADLEFVGATKSPRARNMTTHFTFSDQNLSLDATRPGAVIVADGPRFTFGSMVNCDKNLSSLELRYDDALRSDGLVPRALIADDWVSPGKKPEVLKDLATEILDTGVANAVTMALLGSLDPEFTTTPDTFEVDDISELVKLLDHSYLAVQGPPGTGKTYQAANAIYDAVTSGKRVGICATSHAAISNLLEAAVARFSTANNAHQLHAVKKYSGDLFDQSQLSGVSYTKSNADAASAKFNVVAGTTWLFASDEVRSNPVDILFIDEAGQMALADALAASMAAFNVVLLGDPLQLPQVTLAEHEAGSGVSVLVHVLGQETMPKGRGVFLPQSRRMHKDICDFVSNHIYQSRLTSHATCTNQNVDGHGTGLRRLVATHESRTRSSVEEAQLVLAATTKLIGSIWVGPNKKTRAIEASDILVVAPYNDQVDLLRRTLENNPITAGVEVGTVDRFQGREAPIVIYTLTTSNAQHMPRATSFLFSKNRLNVAVSRAQGLAYVICTDALLDTKARSVEEVHLIGTLAAAVASAEVVEF